MIFGLAFSKAGISVFSRVGVSDVEYEVQNVTVTFFAVAALALGRTLDTAMRDPTASKASERFFHADLFL